MNRFFPVLIVLLMGSGLSLARAQTGLDTVLEQMAATGGEFRNLAAHIERTKVVVFVDVRSTESGEIYFQGGGDDSRVRMTISEPAPQHLLMAEGRAQIYRPRINQLDEFDFGERRDIAEFFVLGFGPANATLRENYDVALVGEEVVDGVQTSVLELESRSERVRGMFPTFQLWVDQSRWVPVQALINEASGDYQIISYSNIVINGRLPGDTFELDIPSDVNR